MLASHLHAPGPAVRDLHQPRIPNAIASHDLCLEPHRGIHLENFTRHVRDSARMSEDPRLENYREGNAGATAHMHACDRGDS